MPLTATTGEPAHDRRTHGRAFRCLIVGLAGVAGAVVAVLATPASPDAGVGSNRFNELPYRDLLAFGAAFHAIRTRAVDVRGEGQLIDAAIAGLVATLDRHSRYLTAAEFRRLDQQDTGSYSGVGLEVEAGGTVGSTLPDAPAARAGLAPGTVIESIAGAAAENLGPDKVADLLRGEPGSTVHLRVVRPGERAPSEVVLTREWLPLHPVRMRALDTVAYVGLDHFDAFTSGRLLKAVATLKAGIGRDRLSGFVLDLRGNPGGLVVQAVAVAGAFLGRGEIVRLVGRGSGNVERFALDRTGEDRIDGLPLVVLVDRGTASAAEIVAGALQDHRRATVIGTRTYGKGAVQTTYAHRGGRGLRLTTAWVVTPAGHRVEGNGIEPDCVVPKNGTVAGVDGGPSGRRFGSGGSLQDGIVEDGLIDPSRDRQLTAGLRRLQAVDQAGDDGLIQRNDPAAGR
ncbi:S41 family peptidase [Methylobacterium mesophilicum SR1.6/6]|uniref:S41 family peptidase n=1 Tax=Methylobacterium mesophilicum SR1.6/6 TaxID=908290 RepID=A0A6B9FM80_9HYPH|nr:S41 family peptidase [Methylobacterium mesophilicum SR1.6/6]